MLPRSVDVNYNLITRVLCPTMTQALEHPMVVQQHDREYDAFKEQQIIGRIFRSAISIEDWQKSKELSPALRQTVIRNATAIHAAVYFGKTLPPNISAEVAELVRSYRAKLVAAGPRAWLKLPQDLQQTLFEAYMTDDDKL